MKTKLLFFATMLTCMLLSPGKIHASDMPDAVCSNEIAAMHRPTHDIDRFIKKKYPGCRIIDRDYDDGHLEVKIGHKGTEKTLIFNRRHDWVRTVWELRRTQLPKTVVKAMERMGYSFRHIDDNDNMAVETPDGRFYAVQIDTDRRDHIYIVSEKGRVAHQYTDDGWNDGRVCGDYCCDGWADEWHEPAGHRNRGCCHDRHDYRHDRNHRGQWD